MLGIVAQTNALVEARKLVLTALDPLIEGLKDKDIPLASRWAAYTELVDNDILVKEDLYGDGFIGTLGSNLTLYDDFYIVRNESKSFTDMYDQIIENDIGDNLEAWQEEVLASGYSSFCNDW